MNQRSSISLARTLRQKVGRAPFGLDHPYWDEESDFDVEFHARHIALRDTAGRRARITAADCD